jgi:mannose-1-phosphate guanylyltransferase/mannose-6-phosphate isomerase
MIIPVILSGGSGTRLWPLSTPEKPKQFLPLVTDKTLFQETLLRLNGIPELADPIVVCNEAHRFLVAEQLREIGAKAEAIVLEPEGRNTAPAIGVAAMLASGSVLASGSDPNLLVLPADHVIADIDALRCAIEKAVSAAESGKLVTFGIVPTRAETGYGYIERGDAESAWFTVERFVEKPDAGTAESYIDSGRFLWNSGMFVFGAAAFLSELERCAPEIFAACRSACGAATRDGVSVQLGSEFLESPADSIDYAVMEVTDRAAVVPLDAGWSDVGSWAALHEVLSNGEFGNVALGNVVADSCSGSLVRSSGRPVVAIGLRDAMVVETDEAVLIVARGQEQRVKEAVRLLRLERPAPKK